MARTQARIHVSLWQNAEFIALPEAAQRMYLVLLSQPTISLLGVLALTPGRWARLAPDTTVEDVEKALQVLEDAAFIVVEHETEEVLVRSFLRHDGGWKSEKTRAAAAAQRGLVVSKSLLLFIEREIAKLERDE